MSVQMSKQPIDNLTLDESRKIIIMMYADLCYASGVLDGAKVPNNYIGDRIAALDEMLFTTDVDVRVAGQLVPSKRAEDV